MPPTWFDDQLTAFSEAVRLAAIGDVAMARVQLARVRGGDLQTWFIEHGQTSGRFRNRQFGLPKPNVITPLDPIASPQRMAKEVLSRDGYRCRYCGLRLVPKAVLAAFAEVVGREYFSPTGRNLERHGVVLAFRANVDHVLPWKLGGRTDMNNLVSACWCCNYGKAGFTLEQIAVEDPRLNPVSSSNGWDGLTSYVSELRKRGKRMA